MKDILEIRIRKGKNIAVRTPCGVEMVDAVLTVGDIESILRKATKNSMYAYENELSKGYIDYSGGIRIGVCGDGKIGNRGQIVYREIYSLNIRIPHEVIGCADRIADLLKDFKSTLIVSPPGGGKTTLLREATRILSENYDVLVIDERGEICGKNLSLQRGARCDVLQGVPKSKVFENVIRTMSPEIVVCDELFGGEDVAAVERLTEAGIEVLATYHCGDIPGRDIVGPFRNLILLASNRHPGRIKSIINLSE